MLALLSAGPVFATAGKVHLNVAHQWVNANGEPQRFDLSVKAHVVVQCQGDSAFSSSVTASLVDPTGATFGPQGVTASFHCGSNVVSFTLLDVRTVQGKYTLTTTAVVGTYNSVTDISVFDPPIQGTMGPL